MNRDYIDSNPDISNIKAVEIKDGPGRKSLFFSKGFLLSEVNSTNAFCRDFSSNDLPVSDSFFVWARRQRSGKGRLEKKWHDFGSANLFFSLFLFPNNLNQITAKIFSDPVNIPLLTMLMGEATKKALIESLQEQEKIPGRFYLKWPNDLIFKHLTGDEPIQYLKIAGILCQSVFSGNIATQIIIGIGINLSHDPAKTGNQDFQTMQNQIKNEQGYIPGFLREITSNSSSLGISKGSLIRNLLYSMQNILENYFLNNDIRKKEILAKISASLLWLNEEVRFFPNDGAISSEGKPAKPVYGILQGIDTNGAISIFDPIDNKNKSFISGSLRSANQT